MLKCTLWQHLSIKPGDLTLSFLELYRIPNRSGNPLKRRRVLWWRHCRSGVSSCQESQDSRTLSVFETCCTRSKKLKKITQACNICAELKPKFHHSPEKSLVRVTRAFQRLSIDFNSPLPAVSKNKYILSIAYEYSRFPFAYSCAEQTTRTVITYLNILSPSLAFHPSFTQTAEQPSWPTFFEHI